MHFVAQCNKVQDARKSENMNRLEYVCTTCGRPFGRNFCAKRHLTNVHEGRGTITGVMDYMLGVVNGSYAWPRLPQNTEGSSNSGRRRNGKQFKDMFDRMYKIYQIYQIRKDNQASQNQVTPPLQNDPPPSHELLVGHVCIKCYTRLAFYLVNLHDNRPMPIFHKCEQEQLAYWEK